MLGKRRLNPPNISWLVWDLFVIVENGILLDCIRPPEVRSMKAWTVFILLFALTILSPSSNLAQTPGGQGQDEEKIVVGTNEVLLDAVVRDKKGHPVKDLTASDFQVSEDGISQQVQSFRLVSREPRTPTAAASAGGTESPAGVVQKPAPLLPNNTNRP